MWKILKKIIIFIFMIVMILIIRYDERIYPRYQIINDGKIFGMYSEGNVYIGDEKFLNKLMNIKENDILILDNRKDNDPTMKIISSYKITDNNLQNEIIRIMLAYENRNPSHWNRSMKKMKIEWTAHNLLYYFDYQTNRTRDVDFNNNDENVYNRNMLKQIIKKIIKKSLNFVLGN